MQEDESQTELFNEAKTIGCPRWSPECREINVIQSPDWREKSDY
ncbi:hypothetical protein ARMA_2347 [Ardenticatena maritima]|uniref:Uncharacterized protein n=1 Tax=Ardenticatena maritima TaxID=872965 RepID=A0A0M9UDE4_9CHLR|nr:hypothetical protein ARMA_2347 [Ardenticatena maritima]